jgi:hypothetical protein
MCTEAQSNQGAAANEWSNYWRKNGKRRARCHATAAVYLRSSLFWVVMHRHLTWTTWLFKVGPIGSPKMSVNNYQRNVRNIPEKRRPQSTKISFVGLEPAAKFLANYSWLGKRPETRKGSSRAVVVNLNIVRQGISFRWLPRALHDSGTMSRCDCVWTWNISDLHNALHIPWEFFYRFEVFQKVWGYLSQVGLYLRQYRTKLWMGKPGNQDLIPINIRNTFSYLHCQRRFWGLHNLLSIGRRKLFPWF